MQHDCAAEVQEDSGRERADTQRASLESSELQGISEVCISMRLLSVEQLGRLSTFFRNTDRESAWEKLIKPGIKQNLIGALLASQENMVNRKNSFQLYGADFLIMDDLSVWLIEINTNPRLHPPSSTVTEKLYPEIIEDTIKGSC